MKIENRAAVPVASRRRMGEQQYGQASPPPAVAGTTKPFQLGRI